MKPIPFLWLLLPACVSAGSLGPGPEEDTYRGPTREAIELLAVKETSPYGSDEPFSARIRNGSEYYLDRLAIRCTVTDDRGFRILKSVVFRSDPMLSLHIAIPPIRTPELGIPPGAVATVGLYTDDNRWTRGHGEYRYDCRVHDVDGSE